MANTVRFFSLLVISSALLGSVNPAQAEGPTTPIARGPIVGHQATLTLGQERAWGERILRELRAQNQLSRDEVLNDYLQKLADKLYQAAPRSPFLLKVFAIPSAELNAFTFFGGHIGVYYGLLVGMESEVELLAVLAHEYAHITQRHLARALENQRSTLPITVAEMLGAIAIGAVTSPQAGLYATQAILDLHFQKMMRFSRVHEQEADREAIQTLIRLHYDPKALLSMFDRLSKGTYFQDKAPEYLSSHPLNEYRRADTENRIAQLKQNTMTVLASSRDFDWMFARARVACDMRSRKHTIAQLRNQIEQTQEGQPVWRRAQYALALTLQAQREYTQATHILSQLCEQYPDDWVVALSLAEVHCLQGKTQKGLEQLALLFERHPRVFPIAMAYSEQLIRAKQATEAKRCLDQYRDSHDDFLILHELLTQVYRLQGDIAQVHQAQAEWHLLRGDSNAAKLQAELALQHLDKKDRIAMAKIDALQSRIRDFAKEN